MESLIKDFRKDADVLAFTNWREGESGKKSCLQHLKHLVKDVGYASSRIYLQKHEFTSEDAKKPKKIVEYRVVGKRK